MILFIDFDHTLFDSTAFQDKLGFRETQKGRLPHALEKINNAARLAVLRPGLEEFVYADVPAFLAGSENHTKFLLTYGNPLFQKLKFKRSGLGGHFDGAHFTGYAMKGDWLKEKRVCPETEKAVFLDDNISQLSNMRDLCPQVVPVRMRRRGGYFSEEPTPAGYHEVRDLQEFSEFLKTLE